MFINNLTQHLPDFMVQFMSRIVFLSDLAFFVLRVLLGPKGSQKDLLAFSNLDRTLNKRLANVQGAYVTSVEKGVMIAKLKKVRSKWKIDDSRRENHRNLLIINDKISCTVFERNGISNSFYSDVSFRCINRVV